MDINDDLIGEESLKLFNPFHDNLGRFASKAGGAAVSGLSNKQKEAVKTGIKNTVTIGKYTLQGAAIGAITGGIIGGTVSHTAARNIFNSKDKKDFTVFVAGLSAAYGALHGAAYGIAEVMGDKTHTYEEAKNPPEVILKFLYLLDTFLKSKEKNLKIATGFLNLEKVGFTKEKDMYSIDRKTAQKVYDITLKEIS